MQKIVLDSAPGSSNKALYLWSDMPRFEVSTAPLADKEGKALQLPDSPWLDHALFLSDQQVRPSLPFLCFYYPTPPPTHPPTPHPSPESRANVARFDSSSSSSSCKGAVVVLVSMNRLLAQVTSTTFCHCALLLR